MQTTRFREALEALVSGEKSPADALGIPRRVLDGMYTLGCDALARDRAKDAEALFLRCVQLDPSRSEFWLALASARKATGEVEAAGELYQFAAMFGEDCAPLAYAAACFAEVGQHERAQTLAEHVRASLADTTRVEPWLTVAEAGAR
jgi:tetratricopeptide (TPR) repeat protein